MKMTKTEESLMKMILSGDMHTLAKTIAGKLMEKFPEGEFFRIPATAWDKRNGDHSDTLAFKFKYQDSGKCYNLHAWFRASVSHNSATCQVGLLKGGKEGGPLYKIDGNQFYAGETYKPGKEIQVVRTFKGNLFMLHNHIALLEEQREAQTQRQDARRVTLAAKKAAIKQAVYAKHSVIPTPEIETLYDVVSRLQTKASISKAFGELLPLINKV